MGQLFGPTVGGRGIGNLQALRAVAALLVVFVHLEGFLASLHLKPFGHGGVDLFFVISGFIMVYTTRNRPVSALDFMTNRIIRIVPFYWFMTISVFGIAVIAPTLLQSTSTDPVQLGKSLLFIPFKKANGLFHPVLFLGWTLNFEMFFYALFALGLLLPRREFGIIVVAGVIAALVLSGWLFRPSRDLAVFYSDPILLEFAAGMMLGLYHDRLPTVAGMARVGILFLCAAALAANVLLPLAWPEVSRVLTEGMPALILVAGAVHLHRSGSSTSNRWLILLGDASYSIYLTHPFITQAAQKAGRSLGKSPALTVVAVAVVVAVVAAVGVVTHKRIEQPLITAAKRLIRGRSSVPSVG